MDMKEASAMTEASGLIGEQGSDGRPIESASQDFAIRCAERLRRVTIEAPLLSCSASGSRDARRSASRRATWPESSRPFRPRSASTISRSRRLL
jgi:hypothetical protein